MNPAGISLICHFIMKLFPFQEAFTHFHQDTLSVVYMPMASRLIVLDPCLPGTLSFSMSKKAGERLAGKTAVVGENETDTREGKSG